MLKKTDQPLISTDELVARPVTTGASTSLVRNIVQAVLMVGIVFAGVFAMNRLTALREEAPKRPPFQTVYTVDSVTASKGRHQPNLLVYGEVQASESIELRSLVAGKVISVNPDLKVGGWIEKDTELFQIDPFVYELALGRAKADLSETKARIQENIARVDIEESRIERLREQVEFAENDLSRISLLKQNGTATAKQVEDRALIVSQRRQSLEQSELNLVAERSRLEQLEAVKERYQWARMQAERDLEDTRLLAPSSGIVSQKNMAIGRLVNANDVVISIYDANQLEVRFTLTDERFGRIQADEVGITGRTVEVIWSVGGEEFRYPAMIDRIGAQITSSRGGVEVIAVIKGVTNAALRPGAFVEVIVPDKAFENRFRVPESALYGNRVLYVISDGKLVARDVKLNARDGDYVIVSGNLADGEQILTTRIAEIAEGLSVRSPEAAITGGTRTGSEP